MQMIPTVEIVGAPNQEAWGSMQVVKLKENNMIVLLICWSSQIENSPPGAASVIFGFAIDGLQ
jgi:hypothetical protein